MGYMTEISILNDAIDVVLDNPDQLADAIREGMNGEPGDTHAVRSKTGGIFINPITTQPSHHADDPRVYIASQNSFTDISKYALERQFRDRLEGDEALRGSISRRLTEVERIVADTRRWLNEVERRAL